MATRPRRIAAALLAIARVATWSPAAAAADPHSDTLVDADPRTRAEAVRALGRDGDAAAETALVRALGDSDPVVRAAAVDALARSGGPAVVAPLVARFDDEAVPVRRSAIEAAAELCRLFPGALGDRLQLRLQVSDPAPEVRAAAIAALARLGDRAGITAIMRQLDDRPTSVTASRLAAIVALGALVAVEAVPTLTQLARDGPIGLREEALQSLAAIAGGGVTEALPPLLGALHDPTLRLPAARSLASLGAAAVPSLLERLADGRDADAVVELLGEIADARAAPALLAELAHGVLPRLLVLSALARLAAADRDVARSVGPVLGGFLASGDPIMRRAVVTGLVPDDDAGLRGLMMASRDADDVVRLRAIASLAPSRSPAAAARLVELLGAGDPATRAAAARAITGRVEPPAIAPLVSLALLPGDGPAERAARHAAGGALTGACDRSCVALMRAAVRRAAGAARADGLRALGAALRARASDAADVELLRSAAAAGDELAAEGALASLDALADAGSAPLLIHIALDAKQPAARRRLAVQALGGLPAAIAEPALLRALGEPDATIRAEAAWSLGPRSSAPAAVALAAALHDPSAAVRANALASLGAAAETSPPATLLHDPAPAVRANAVLALPPLNDRLRVVVIHLAAGDPDAGVRFAARRRLAVDDPASAARLGADDPCPATRRPLASPAGVARDAIVVFVAAPDGAALSDAPARLLLPDGHIRSTRTDGSGALHLERVERGAYDVVIDREEGAAKPAASNPTPAR